MKRKIVVIGAGISGLAVARALAGEAEVEVLEKAEKPGGLIKCDVVAGNLFHRVGGHVFNAKNKAVFDWFWSHFDQTNEFFKVKRQAKILIQNKLVGYPLENHLSAFDRETVAKVVSELLEIEASKHGASPAYGNFEDFLRGSFGETLYQLYFKPYNQKLWNVDLAQVALEWLEGKLPMPNIQQIFLSNMVQEEEADMVHATFFYPRTGGSQFIADRLAEGLAVRNGCAVTSIRTTGTGRLVVNGEVEAGALVYTGDVRQLEALLRIQDPALQQALEAVRNLRSNGTSNLLCSCDATDLTWLYLPESFTKAHRIIYTGNFSPANNATGRNTCVVEFSGQVAPEVMREEIRKLPGHLTPIAFNYEPNSYVVQEKDTRARVNALKAQLARYDIYLVGRFAEWEYYNMDKAIEASLHLARRLVAVNVPL